MEKNWIYYISFILGIIMMSGCADEELITHKGSLGDEEVWVTMNFGHQDFDPIEISTRSTLGEVAESRVSDMYALIFVEGKCVYNKYFGSDASIKKNTKAEVANATTECWWVQNRTSETNVAGNSDDDTHGTIRMKTPTIAGGELYLIANANAYTVNISPELLGAVRTKQDLQNLRALLNGDVVTRYGYFPMVAELTGINITSTGVSQTLNATTTTTNVVAELVRLDAKVDVNVTAAKGTRSSYGTGEDIISVTVNEFTPLSWQVMNVPKGTSLIEQTEQTSASMEYFNTQPSQFEMSTTSEETTQHSFSFYMLENNHTSTGVTDYHQRDSRRKDSNGAYLYPIPENEEDEKDIWEYAPKDATYLILKGYLSMNPTDATSGTQEIGADVTYYIHLGDFISSSQTDSNPLNNFSIARNTHYTFNLTIKGVRNIELEVTEKKENQSGATGNIYATKEIIKQLDAHYEQFTLFINENDIAPNSMSWYTSTPFSEGSPKLNDGLEQGTDEYVAQLAKYDYKWVWFMVNPLNDEGTAYVTTNQWYPGDKFRTGGAAGKSLGDEKHLMSVDEFVEYLRTQKTQSENIFKAGGVAVTVFVDEFYYEKHPIENEVQEGLWKKFVNTPSRLLHILSGSNKSLDGESSITTSLITIKQKSIETPYNTNKATLTTAWGCETVDESASENLWFYDENNSHSPSTHKNGYQTSLGSQHAPAETTYNTSQDNGLYNTALLMGLMTSAEEGGQGTYDATKRWDVFLDYNQAAEANFISYLNTGYKGMLYASLLRNRDNNGNGVIDASELKWYIASLGQIAGIFIGELGFSSKTTAIYDESLALLDETANVDGDNMNPANFQAWRRHIVTSTKTLYSVHEGYVPTGYKNGENHRPAVVWAEEGLSTSYYFQEHENWSQGDWAPLSVRCLRNLGLDFSDDEAAKIAIQQESVQPEKLISCEYADNEYSFDLSNVNEKSLRSSATVMELWPSNEFEYNSRPYKGFRTSGTVSLSTTNLQTEYNNLYDYLTAGETTTSYQTTEGWRIPNIREGALMSIYCQNDTWWSSSQTLVGTYYYRSTKNKPNAADDEELQSWAFSKGFASLATNGNWSVKIRPVQDFDPASE